MAPSGLIVEECAAYDAIRDAVAPVTVFREPGLVISTLLDPDDVPVVMGLRSDRALADDVSAVGSDASEDVEKLPQLLRTLRRADRFGACARV